MLLRREWTELRREWGEGILWSKAEKSRVRVTLLKSGGELACDGLQSAVLIKLIGVIVKDHCKQARFKGFIVWQAGVPYYQ